MRVTPAGAWLIVRRRQLMWARPVGPVSGMKKEIRRQRGGYVARRFWFRPRINAFQGTPFALRDNWGAFS